MNPGSAARQSVLLKTIVLCGWAMFAQADLNHEIAGIPDEMSAASGTYHAPFYFETLINRPPDVVWPHLTDLASWIEFDFLPVSGRPGHEGEIVQLYAGQDFYTQTVKVIPDKLLMSVNLPSVYRGEYSTGIGIFLLAPLCADSSCPGTRVSVIMNRRYVWQGDGENGTRQVRESADFQAATRAAWEGRYLPALKKLAETEN